MEKEHNEKENEETMLQQMLSLYFIGEYLTTALAFLPAAIIIFIAAVLGILTDVTTGWIIFFAVVTWYWLGFLERVGKVRVTFPVFHIPLRWIIVLSTIVYLFETCQ